MNRSIILVTLIALVVAVLVATVVSKTLGGKSSSRSAGDDGPRAQILVAAKKLKVGTEVSKEDVEWQDWPEYAMFDGVIERKPAKEGADEDDDDGMGKVLGQRIRRDVQKGQPVTKHLMIEGGEGNFLAASLEEGMRAMGIKINAESSAGGLIKPADRVDVILTYQVRMAGSNAETKSIAMRNASETILSNVLVLAVDQQLQAKEDEKGSVGRTVTLAVSKKDAEILALAKQMGEISLALRRLGEEDVPLAAGQKPPQADLTTDVREVDVLRRIAEIESGGSTTSSRRIKILQGSEVDIVPVKTVTAPLDDRPNNN